MIVLASPARAPMLTAILRAILLAPEVANGLRNNRRVIRRVNHRVGRNCDAAAEEKGGHLNLGKGAAHAIAINRRYTRLQAGNQRLHGIGAANFGNRDRIKSSPDVFFQQAQRTHHFATFRQFFDADGGSADAANDTDKRVIVQLEGI